MAYDDREDIPASYELHPGERSAQELRIRHSSITLGTGLAFTAIIAAAALVTAVISIMLLLHARSVSSFQTSQIHAVDQSNTRLAQEIAGLSNRQSEISAQVAAADPASDSNLITCRDLRNMGLMATTGGSISSVPGTVSLNQSPVSLPAHCSK
jgi:hypothetical protein